MIATNTENPGYSSAWSIASFDLDNRLRQSMEYALASEGSFFRARLAETIAKIVGLGESSTSSLSQGVEYFHLASLILDDLPCMDDAEKRRSLPCLHRVYGESSAILTALALINRAYFLFWEAMRKSDLEASGEAGKLVEDTLGLRGILNGQALDLHFQNTPRDDQTVLTIAALKTGKLLQLAVLLPAILGGTSRYEKFQLKQLAEAWGLCYQIIDDFKDISLGEDVSGKTILRDGTLGRPNLVLTAGPGRAAAFLQKKINEARNRLDRLSNLPLSWESLESFQNKLEENVQLVLREIEAA